MTQQSTVRAYRETYVPAPQQQDLTFHEQALLTQTVQVAGTIMAQRQMTHLVRGDDTPVTNAVGSLVYSFPYMAITALITGSLLFIGFLFLGGDERFYLLFWLVVWGVCSLYYLSKNREQGLRYSSAGIALEEIASREEIAKYTIDRHVELIKERWKRQS